MKKYTTSDMNSNEQISIFQKNEAGENVEVFRMIRTPETALLWDLHAVDNGEIKSPKITRNQYRNDLVERLMSGLYDSHVQEKSL